MGTPSRSVLGISGGNEGVQWNAGYYPRGGAVWLGVNLEGMKYDDWPVVRLIEREISRPLLLTQYRPRVARPDNVTVLWSRDAWQYSARRPIKEANIAPTPVALERLDAQGWAEAPCDRDVASGVQTLPRPSREGPRHAAHRMIPLSLPRGGSRSHLIYDTK